MVEIHETRDMEFPVYIYDAADYAFDEYGNSYVYTAGEATDIFDILSDFLNNEEMSVYDNWSGRCIVTHKAVSFGSDGWMQDLRGNGNFYVEGWQIYMDQENHDYYFQWNY